MAWHNERQLQGHTCPSFITEILSVTIILPGGMGMNIQIGEISKDYRGLTMIDDVIE